MKLMLIAMALTVLAGCTEPQLFPVYERDIKAHNARFDACMAALPAGAGDGELEDAIYACQNVADQQTRACIANCPPGERKTGATIEHAADGGTEPRGGGLRMGGDSESGEAAAPAASPSEDAT